jgi:lambda repressor-like predicted transcriptional regulator
MFNRNKIAKLQADLDNSEKVGDELRDDIVTYLEWIGLGITSKERQEGMYGRTLRGVLKDRVEKLKRADAEKKKKTEIRAVVEEVLKEKLDNVKPT